MILVLVVVGKSIKTVMEEVSLMEQFEIKNLLSEIKEKLDSFRGSL